MLRGRHVVFSAFGSGAGVYALSVTRMAIAERLINWPTTGMSFAHDKWALVKRLSPAESNDAELLVGSRFRHPRTVQVEGASDAHAVLEPMESSLLVVSSYRAEIHRLDARSGTRIGLLRFGGEPDTWHPNDLCEIDGDVWATFFSDPTEGATWNLAPEGRGFLMNLRTGEKLGSFTYPHSPTPEAEGIYVCDSGRSSLVLVDYQGNELRRAELSGFTRGLLIANDRVFVGVSTHRLAPISEVKASASRIHVLDRRSLTEISVIDVPATEVYAIKLALPWHVNQLRRMGRRKKR